MRKLKLIFLLLFALTACKKEKLLICDIYEDTKGYSIGEITKYLSGIGKVTYYYDYIVDSKSYAGKKKMYGQTLTSQEQLDFISFFKIILTDEKIGRLILPDNSVCFDYEENHNYYYILNTMTPFEDTVFRDTFIDKNTIIITNTGELFY